MDPFSVSLLYDTAEIKLDGRTTQRHLNDLRGIFQDAAAEERLLADNPLLYKFFEVSVPEQEGHLLSGISVLQPGKVGDEYYMTKGHYHLREATAEIYLGLRGEGYLLMQTKGGDFRALKMKPGTVAYIPPYWGHRTVNTGQDPLVFYFVYPADAGHDYGTIEKEGFVRLLVDQNGVPAFVDNPRYKKE